MEVVGEEEDDDDDDELKVDSDPVDDNVRPRFGALTLLWSRTGISAAAAAEAVYVGSQLVEGESEVMTVATAGALTGFKIHLRACRFRFDATPNRRPQVSQTKAI